LKLSRKQPSEQGFKKTLDDLQLSLDFPANENKISKANTTTNSNLPTVARQEVDASKSCPKGHFLKTSDGDCIFCRNWLKQINMGYSGVPNNSGPYKRRDIGADYGGSGSIG